MNADPNDSLPELLPPEYGHGSEPDAELSAEPVPVWVPPPSMRFPNMADVGLLFVLMVFGGLVALGLTALALHFHFLGVSTVKQATDDIRYGLGNQLLWYFLTLIGCITLFPHLWQTGLFRGLEWRWGAALRARGQLLGAAVFCLALAVVGGKLMPEPENAPIDEVFRRPGAAWFMFFFGTLLAPFFEEMLFRGFLLPAFCTAYDWSMERIMKQPAPQPDAEGMTVWSVPAMAVGSVLVSIPFAGMHGAQTGYSPGPFVLLFCVSLVLCWVRLRLRSLAASTLVHASYNLLLFSIMIVGTGGFKHLDKM